MGLTSTVCCSHNKIINSLIKNLDNTATSINSTIATNVSTINSTTYSNTSVVNSAIVTAKSTVVDLVPNYSTPIQATSVLQAIYDADLSTFKNTITSDPYYRYPEQLDMLGVNIPLPDIPAKDYSNFQYSGFKTGLSAINSFPPNYLNVMKDCLLTNLKSDLLKVLGYIPEFTTGFNLDWLARITSFDGTIPKIELLLDSMSNANCVEDHTSAYNTIRDTLDLTTDNILDTTAIINISTISAANKSNLINATNTSKKIIDYATDKLLI